MVGPLKEVLRDPGQNLPESHHRLFSVFRAAIEAAGLRLAVDCPALPEPVLVDRDMWEKIVLNLLSNAFKFPREGTIEVKLRWSGGKAVLTVADTGIGIPAKYYGRIFQIFSRLHTYHRVPGTGIWLESRPGEGSTFYFTLPDTVSAEK